jgi:hypothetical protein
MRNFKGYEFPEDLKFASHQLLKNLDNLRDFVGHPIYPSPVSGALARFDGSKTSRHYAVGRKSDAIDIFIDADPFESYIKILQSRLFNRVGVYFDTHYKNKKWVMFHIDLKKQYLFWYRDNSKYHYSTEKNFYGNLLSKFKTL